MPLQRTRHTSRTDTGATAARRIDWTLAYVLAGAVGVVALAALVTSPVTALLGDSSYAVPSTLHGVTAILHVLAATVTVYLAVLMYTGRLEAYRDLRILAALSAFLSLVTIEFKEFIALFTLPLSVAVAFVLWTHGDELKERQNLRQATAVALVASWACLMLAFGLGAAIMRLRSV
jgi:uncharacterized membrane protein